MAPRIKICTLVKGEQRYFDHWRDWHHKRGFGSITIYVDGDDLEDYQCDEVRRVLYSDGSRQSKTFNDFIAEHQQSDDWCLFIDGDEYADFTADDVQSLITEHPRYDALRFCQVPYIAEDDTYRWQYADQPVTERFIRQGINCRYQPGKIALRLAAGKKMPSAHMAMNTKTFQTFRFKIRHYITKSKEEWDWRRFVRGDVNVLHYRQEEDFLAYNELI
jgi:hypothetical protein